MRECEFKVHVACGVNLALCGVMFGFGVFPRKFGDLDVFIFREYKESVFEISTCVFGEADVNAGAERYGCKAQSVVIRDDSRGRFYVFIEVFLHSQNIRGQAYCGLSRTGRTRATFGFCGYAHGFVTCGAVKGFAR